jgi:hypothetical protein
MYLYCSTAVLDAQVQVFVADLLEPGFGARCTEVLGSTVEKQILWYCMWSLESRIPHPVFSVRQPAKCERSDFAASGMR